MSDTTLYRVVAEHGPTDAAYGSLSRAEYWLDAEMWGRAWIEELVVVAPSELSRLRAVERDAAMALADVDPVVQDGALDRLYDALKELCVSIERDAAGGEGDGE